MFEEQSEDSIIKQLHALPAAIINEIRCYDQKPLLHEAFYRNFFTLIDYLVAKGCDLNISNSQGETLAHLVALEGNAIWWQWILAHLRMIDIEAKTVTQNTVYHYAAYNKNADFLNLFFSHETDATKYHQENCLGINAVTQAIQLENAAFLRHYLALPGVNIYETDFAGNNMLHHIMEHNAKKCFNVLTSSISSEQMKALSEQANAQNKLPYELSLKRRDRSLANQFKGYNDHSNTPTLLWTAAKSLVRKQLSFEEEITTSHLRTAYPQFPSLISDAQEEIEFLNRAITPDAMDQESSSSSEDETTTRVLNYHY